MSQIVYETALKNYPGRWTKEMLDKLLGKRKLTQAEYDKLIARAGNDSPQQTNE